VGLTAAREADDVRQQLQVRSIFTNKGPRVRPTLRPRCARGQKGHPTKENCAMNKCLVILRNIAGRIVRFKVAKENCI
jgi:hypothetical protein